MASITLSGGSTEMRSGDGPTTTWPDSPSSTTEGVVVLPSEFGIEPGLPSLSSCASEEYVVPRSMPIVCPSSNFIGAASNLVWCHVKGVRGDESHHSDGPGERNQGTLAGLLLPRAVGSCRLVGAAGSQYHQESSELTEYGDRRSRPKSPVCPPQMSQKQAGEGAAA